MHWGGRTRCKPGLQAPALSGREFEQRNSFLARAQLNRFLTHPQARGGLQGVLSRRGRRACARRKAGGLRVSLGRWDPQARGRSARRGLRAAAQPASRGPGPAPPLVPSPPWDSYRAGRATRELPGTLPASPLVGSRPRRGTRSRTGRGAPGAKSQARGVLPPLVASRTQGGRWSGSPSPSPPLPQSQRDPGSSRTACGGLPRTPLCVQPSISGVEGGE